MKSKIDKLIAVVEDDPDILELVMMSLKKEGYRVKGFPDGGGLLKFISAVVPDLIVLDLMLPDYNGLDICKTLKNDKKYLGVPIIMLTAKADEVDKIIGLEIGADDYVTKPFSPRELAARVKATLRRGIVLPEEKITIRGILEIDLKKYTTTVGGRIVNLTPTEYKILNLLAKRKGWVYSRDQILDHLDISEKGVLDRNVDVHIRNLRKKLGEAGKFIKNIRTIGYKIDE